ncbi:hypothetical protein F511_22262 [Dorcoceras hygrometricum]|uniref:Uncharacterized protein n=1 Tax=Dorcoceras hygrometricum TaxID=472368 RepID=A0A2Z7BQQ9_9LAMI|nr:hypothetical protein F511_22262 [Dorcoceras hygrometricum]
MRDKRIFTRRRFFDHRATSAHGQRATAGHRWRNGLRITAGIGRATCATIARPACNEVHAAAGHGQPPCAASAHGPRPEARFLRQPALEGLTRSARMETPRKVGRNKFRRGAAATAVVAGGGDFGRGGAAESFRSREVKLPKILLLCSTHRAQFPCGNLESSTCVTLNGSGIQLAVGPQPLWLRNHNFGLAQRIMVKRLATSRHDPLGITDSTCKNQLVVVSVHYGPFNPYIPIRSTTIGKSRVVEIQ